MTLDMLGKMNSDMSNPFIAGALEVFGETENRYSGIPTIRSERSAAGLPEPLFESVRGVFRVTLYNSGRQENIGDNEKLLLDFCRTPRSRDEIAVLFRSKMTIDYAMSSIVHPPVEKGVLGLTLPEKPKS